MKTMKLLIIGLGIMFLSSCVTMPPAPTGLSPAYPPTIVPRQNMFHVVAPGETLWRISKTYDVTIEDIMMKNQLTRSNELMMGQRLIIPSAKPPTPIISLYPTNKWKYIIIHHSATDVGSALKFHYAHQRRGFSRGLGYHFVIDNGSSDKPDGYIEVAPRWIKQQNGAHCKASNMNSKGIGICLVGDFTGEYVSEKQLSSLVYLVNILRNYYHIPLKNIMGHGQVPGANTECPGKRFPWSRFFTKLKSMGN